MDAQRVTRVIFIAGLPIFGLMLILSGGTGETEQCVSAIAMSPDGNLLAAGMYNSRNAQVPFKHYDADVCRTVKVFSLDRPEHGVVIAQEMRLGNQGPLHRTTPAVKFLDGGRQLAVVLNEGYLKVWDLGTTREVRAEGSLDDRVAGFDFSPDERLVALIRASGLWVGRTLDGDALHRIDDLYMVFWEVPDVAFSPNSKFLIATGGLHKITVWDTATWKSVYELAAQQNESFHSVDFSPDSRLLAIASFSSIHLRNMETGQAKVIPVQRVAPVRGHGCQVRFLPDNHTLAVLDGAGVSLIDVEREAVVQRIASSSMDAFTCLAVSPRGDLLATGDSAGHVALWDIATGAKTRELVIEGVYRTPWPIPAGLLLIWTMLYRILTKHRLFT